MFLVMRDSDQYVNGIAIIPSGMTVEDARRLMDAASDKARMANPDEWNYEDVQLLLKQDGFNFAESWDEWWDD
jgi:hypothetical protein